MTSEKIAFTTNPVEIALTGYASIQVLYGAVTIGAYTEGTSPDSTMYTLNMGDVVDNLSGTIGVYKLMDDTDARIIKY